MSTASAALLKILADRKAMSSQRQKTIKPEMGRGRYRILPGWRGGDDETFFHDFGQHFVKDAAGVMKAVYVCVSKTFGRQCAVCDAIAAGIHNAAGDDLTIKRLKDAASSGRVLLNVLHIDGKTPTVVQILEVAPSVFNGKKGVGGIVSLFEEWPSMLSLDQGHDIIIERSGSGMDTSYGVQIAGASKPVPAEVLKQLHNLDQYVAQESEEAARRALVGVSAISGLLSPPGTYTGAIAAPRSADTPSPETLAGLERDVTPISAATVVATVAGVTVAAAPAAAPVAAPAAPAAPQSAVVTTGDAEVDALLRQLEGEGSPA
jgi:hypothetical protein